MKLDPEQQSVIGVRLPKDLIRTLDLKAAEMTLERGAKVGRSTIIRELILAALRRRGAA